MKPINELTASAVQMASQPEKIQRRTAKVDERTGMLVNMAMAGIALVRPKVRFEWPATDTQAGKDSDAYQRRLWALAFAKAGIRNPEQINAGLEALACSADDRVPTAGQFINLCRPKPGDYGLPALEQAFADAIMHAHPSCRELPWKHPAIKHAAELCGMHILIRLDDRDAKQRFAEYYTRTVEFVAAGGELAPLPLLEHKAEPAPRDVAAGKGFIDKMRQVLRGAAQ